MREHGRNSSGFGFEHEIKESTLHCFFQNKVVGAKISLQIKTNDKGTPSLVSKV